MISEELMRLEKRSRKMNVLASKSHDRRIDWCRHTLNVVEQDVNKGGEKKIEHAQTIAKGKQSCYIEVLYRFIIICLFLLVNSLFPRSAA